MLRENNVIEQLNESSENLHYLQVKESAIEGVGLFSGVNLAAGTILFEIKGERVVHPEYDPYLADKNPNWMGVGYCEWIVMPPNNYGLYINHSCNPNAIINDKLQIVTFKPVKAHQELTLDYSTTELDPDWTMKCSCGEFDCRKILRSFQYLPQVIQNKYSTFLNPIFLKMVDMAHLQQPVFR
jgi:hypothetical protein